MIDPQTYYPLWGRIDVMAIHHFYREGVGFITAIDYDTHTGAAQRIPIGTFFTFQTNTPEGNRMVWMGTVRHVIDGATEPHALYVDPNGNTVEWPVHDGWIYPKQPKRDLAIRVFDPEAADVNEHIPFLLQAMPIEMSFEYIGVDPYLGIDVFFLGLLASNSVPALYKKGIAVARTGSVAALNVDGVHWRSDSRIWRADHPCHLIDTRSFGGFSGSPCFLQFSYPGPRHKEAKLPEIWHQMAELRGMDLGSVGDMHRITIWWGVFAAHIGESGIGVVIPTSVLAELLEGDEAIAVKKATDKAAKERDENNEAVGQSAPVEHYSEDQYLTDLFKATRRLGDEPDREPKSRN